MEEPSSPFGAVNSIGTRGSPSWLRYSKSKEDTQSRPYCDDGVNHFETAGKLEKVPIGKHTGFSGMNASWRKQDTEGLESEGRASHRETADE